LLQELKKAKDYSSHPTLLANLPTIAKPIERVKKDMISEKVNSLPMSIGF